MAIAPITYTTDFLFNINAIEKINEIGGATTDLIGSVNGLIDASASLQVVSLSPAVTPTTTMGLSAKTLPKTHDKLTSKMLNLGGSFALAGASYPNNRFITNASTVNYGTGTAVNPKVIKHFIFNGLKFEFEYKEQRGSYEIIVDGVSQGLQNIATTTGAIKFGSVEFPSSKTRLVTIVGDNALLGDFYTQTYDTVVTPPVGRKVLIAGDSYTEGVAADFGKGYVNILTSKYAYTNIVNSGLGGTGYVKDNRGRPALLNRYVTDIINQSPDVIVLAMGINDLNESISTVSAAAQSIVSGIKSSLPNSIIVMLSSWSPRTPDTVTLNMNAALKSVADSSDIAFINTSGSINPWFYGTGKIGATTGDGNSDVMISSDGTHPSDLGHEYIASMLHTYISKLGVSIR